MTAKRKPPNAGKGRKPGVPNKATANARAAIGAFVDKNTGRLQKLLDKIERVDGPLAAWKCIVDMIEYHVPKLSRTEHTGKVQHSVAQELSDDELEKIIRNAGRGGDSAADEAQRAEDAPGVH